MSKRRKPRFVHIECQTAEGYRWLKRTIRSEYASESSGGGFLVTDESRWAETLAAADGREV